MNYQKRLRERNRVFGLIRQSNSSGSHVNCIRFNATNTNEHEGAKAAICLELLRRKVLFYTEATFKNGKRCDIIAFNPKTGDSRIIEVLHSETLSEAKEKTKEYPDLDIIYIKTKEFNLDELDI